MSCSRAVITTPLSKDLSPTSLLFRDFVGKFVYTYLDDTFIFTDTIEDQQRHIRLIVSRLHQSGVVLNREQCDLEDVLPRTHHQ